MVQTFIMSGKTSDFTTNYSPSIILDPNKQYEAALLSIDMYNSIPNITNENNIFQYSLDDGNTWKTIAFDTGSYQLSAINDELQRLMIVNNDYDHTHASFYITITANVSKLKSIINITNSNCKVNFNTDSSIGSVLGFKNEVIGAGYNESPNIVDIIKVNSILVNTDIIVGSLVNGFNTPAIYSFFPNVPPGYKIVERPSPTLTFFSVSKHEISSMKIWLTDQNNNMIDLRGETITVRIGIREIKNVKDEVTQAIKELKNKNII